MFDNSVWDKGRRKWIMEDLLVMLDDYQATADTGLTSMVELNGLLAIRDHALDNLDEDDAAVEFVELLVKNGVTDDGLVKPHIRASLELTKAGIRKELMGLGL